MISENLPRRGRRPVEDDRRQRLALLGGVIREERRSRRLTQKKLARAIGYAGASTICKIEKGSHAALNADTVRAIFDHLGIAPTPGGPLDLDGWMPSDANLARRAS